MEDRLNRLEREEIREYRRELREYIEKIPDELVYPYFDIMPMTDKEYDRICRDLAEGGYYTLLARFAERRNGVRAAREEDGAVCISRTSR